LKDTDDSGSANMESADSDDLKLKQGGDDFAEEPGKFL